jgi:hypothetical protein
MQLKVTSSVVWDSFLATHENCVCVCVCARAQARVCIRARVTDTGVTELSFVST